MDTHSYQAYYFIGIGGIGMSALARFFNAMGKTVGGYDRTQTLLTLAIEKEGISVHYADDITCVESVFLEKNNTLVIYTPAIPENHTELNYFLKNGFQLIKRAAVLGLITRQFKGIAVAGTHGKTTVSTLTGHLLFQSAVKAAAILGGISINYQTNLLLPKPDDEFVVVEADEYDRSLLQLYPYLAVVTALDADHLDIYGDRDAIVDTFNQFVSQINSGGILIHKYGLDWNFAKRSDIRIFSYSIDYGDFHTQSLKLIDGYYHFDLIGPGVCFRNLILNVPGLVNVENAIVASASAFLCGASESEIRAGLLSFTGIRRRMEYVVREDNQIYIDDYAHHPAELAAAIDSVRRLFPERNIKGIFQPHLYSRTRDFATGFAESLSMLDELILLDIYPARELPIDGVTSEIILDKVTLEKKSIMTKLEVLEYLSKCEVDILLTLG
ncbi:MAG: hypothetical protein RIS47_2214, partial [Bacteroidota bacterium]